MSATRARVRDRRMRGFLIAFASLASAVVVFRPAISAHVRAASLLVRASGDDGFVARLCDTAIVEENLVLTSEFGRFRARVYRPADAQPRRGIVLAHGVQYMGIDEPRLIPFARNLARAGFAVMTPELSALADYRIHPSTVAELRVAVRSLATRAWVRDGGVGIMGLSFAGGLALVAASDRSMRGTVAFVVAIGAHHDLRRVSRFLATDELETSVGTRHMHAHDYGLIVYFYAHAELFVSPDQLDDFRDALRQTLHLDRPAGRRAANQLSGAARELFDEIDRGDKSRLTPRVLSTIPGLAADMAALSPAGHMEGLRGVPVFLLHGAADDVMPPTEAEDNAHELSRYTDVRLLLSPNIKHVTIEGEPSWHERWRILHAMAEILEV